MGRQCRVRLFGGAAIAGFGILLGLRVDGAEPAVSCTGCHAGHELGCFSCVRWCWRPWGGQLVGDRPGVGQGPGEPVELGHDQGVAGSARGERFTQPRSLSVGAGEAVVDVDPFRFDAEGEEPFSLGGQVLLIGGASGVPDK